MLNITLDQRAARKIGFPLSEVLVERERLITDGTLKATKYALQHGIAMNIAGGTHHAYTNRGEAFCMLNDQAIGARYLQAIGLSKKILIVDLDVHQGNGTADIFQNDKSVFTFYGDFDTRWNDQNYIDETRLRFGFIASLIFYSSIFLMSFFSKFRMLLSLPFVGMIVVGMSVLGVFGNNYDPDISDSVKVFYYSFFIFYFN